MPFQKGHSLSNGRPKGSQNKITVDTKKKLQYILDEIIDSLDVSEMNLEQKLKYIQIASGYVMPRLKHTTEDNNWFEQPLFVTELEANIIKRDNEGKWISEKRKIHDPENQQN